MAPTARPARLTPDKLRSALGKGSFAPAYLVAGSETILKDEAVRSLIDSALDPGLRDFNLDFLSANNLDPAELEAACSTLPMMAERRVVVVRDIEAWRRKTRGRKAAAAYLAKPAAETLLVLVQGDDKAPDKVLSAAATLVDCSPLTGKALDGWLDRQLDGAGVALTRDGREHLLRATGGELGLLTTEIAKLSGLASTEPIDGDTVGELVGVRPGETVDDWRDAVLGDDVANATNMLPGLLGQSGVSAVRLVMILGGSLLMLQWARSTARQRRIRGRALAQAVKNQCFQLRPMVGSYGPFADLAARVVAEWPLSRIGHAVRATHAADVALKSTTISNDAAILTDLILDMAVSRPRKDR